MIFSTDKDFKILLYYKETLSVSKTARHFCCCANSVYKILRENSVDLPARSFQKDNYKTSKAFTDFTKEEDSYFYGLLLTDGHIDSIGNGLGISLKESDLYMLEKLREYIGCDNKICKQTRDEHIWYTFSIKSLTIKERLTAQNFTARKSKKEKLPNFDWVNNRHFWRGVVDGDGSVFFTNNSPKLSLCGSTEMLEGFNRFCQVNCFTKPRKLDNTKSEDFFTMCYSGEEAMRIMKLLYDDSIVFLTRKKNRVEQYKETYIPKSHNKGIRILPSGRYNVKIGYNRKRLNIGTYNTYEEALSARLEAEIKYQGKIRDDIHSSTAA